MRVLVNPAAGGGRAGKLAARWLDGLDVDVRTTVGPEHATALVRAGREAGESVFVAVGGDGTLFEVVNGALSAGSGRPTVGILPLGTGNSFGRDIGVNGPEDARRALEDRTTRTVDVLRLVHDDGELFSINLTGLGFSAAAGSLTNRRFKRFGAFGYVFAVLVELSRLSAPVVRYRVDGADWVTEPLVMLSLCNSQYTGGAMQMAPGAAIDDGRLDLVRLGPMSRTAFLRAFPKIFAGTHLDLPNAGLVRCTGVDLDLPGPVDVMIDGEVRSLHLTRVEVLPGALEVLCPT
ncbi:MAG: diacylglycerol kinase family lipid kinase [Alphaproteobacteria bacterium]|nr:diacylglycerol kinase family lipid kinase [Alphaproteobacteria bacterium]